MAWVLLSRAAAADLEDIDAYTIEEFGLRQAAKLRRLFQETLYGLAGAPLTAPRRPDYDPPGKTFRYSPAIKRFVIVYEPADDGIRVARVLHGARDLVHELAREAGEGQDPPSS